MSRRKSNILIIDDDKLLCESYSQIVEKQGHTPFYALSLREGLEMLRSEKLFDLVFLDVRLPDANGLEHISEIIENPSSPEIIIITGFGSPEGAELAIKSGALDYIEKPSSADVITLRLVRALDHHRQKLFWLKIKEVLTSAEE